MAIPNPTCAQKWGYHTFRQIAVANFGGWNGWVQAAIEGEAKAHQIRSNAIALAAAVTSFADSKRIVDIYVQAHVEVPRLALRLIPDDSKGAIFASQLMDFLLATIDAGIKAGTGAPTPIDLAPDLAGLVNDIWAYSKVTGLLQKQHALLIAQGYLTDLYRFGDNPGLLAQSYRLARSASFEDRIKAVAEQKYGLTNTAFKQDFDLVATARTIEYVRSNLVSKVVALCESGGCKTSAGSSADTGGKSGVTTSTQPNQQASLPSQGAPQGTTPGRGSEERTSANTALGSSTPSKTGQGLSGSEVATALGPLTEHSRVDAIVQMARQGAIRNPLAPDEVAVILAGTTGGNRANAIGELARLIKPKLTAGEGATILGSSKDLNEHSRVYTIVALARAERFGELSGDAALVLSGTTGGNRANAIGEMAKFFKAGLSAREVADVLGSPKNLSEQSRVHAVVALARAKKLRQPLSGDELALILDGTTGGNRAQALAELTQRR